MPVRVCAESELGPGQAVKVIIDGEPVAVVKDADGACHAVGDTCSHAEISLAEGFVEGTQIECWAHGARFDLATGRALTLPATDPIPVYPVSVVDGAIYVDTATVDTATVDTATVDMAYVDTATVNAAHTHASI